MYFGERFKTNVRVAHINTDTRPATYELDPKVYRLNCLPTTADAAVETLGIGYHKQLRITCDKNYAADIKEMDLVYVYTQPSQDDDVFAYSADYIVSSKVDSLSTTVMLLDSRAGAQNA